MKRLLQTPRKRSGAPVASPVNTIFNQQLTSEPGKHKCTFHLLATFPLKWGSSKKHLLKGKDQGGDWLKKAIRQTRISHLLQKHAIIPEHSGIQKINQRQPININIVFQIEEQ